MPSRDTIVVALGAVVMVLAASGVVAVAHGAPVWLLAAGAFGGAVCGIVGGRLVLHLVFRPRRPAPDEV